MSFGSSVGGHDSSSENSQSSSIALLAENRKKGPAPVQEEVQTSVGSNSRKTTPSPLIDVFTLRSSPTKRAQRLTRWRRITSDDTYSSIPDSEDEDADDELKSDDTNGGTDTLNDSNTFGNETDDEQEEKVKKEEVPEETPPIRKRLRKKKEKSLTKEKDDISEGYDTSEVLLYGATGMGWKLEKKDFQPPIEIPPLLSNSDVSEGAVTFQRAEGAR